jgi:hypothetical protein
MPLAAENHTRWVGDTTKGCLVYSCSGCVPTKSINVQIVVYSTSFVDKVCLAVADLYLESLLIRSKAFSEQQYSNAWFFCQTIM